MQPVSTDSLGIGASSVDPHAQSLATKKRVCEDYEKKIGELTEKGKSLSSNAQSLSRNMQQMEDKLNGAYEDLASLGNCRDAEKKRLRGMSRKYEKNSRFGMPSSRRRRRLSKRCMELAHFSKVSPVLLEKQDHDVT